MYVDLFTTLSVTPWPLLTSYVADTPGQPERRDTSSNFGTWGGGRNHTPQHKLPDPFAIHTICGPKLTTEQMCLQQVCCRSVASCTKKAA